MAVRTWSRKGRSSELPALSVRDVLEMAILAIVYLVAARLGLRLSLVERNITPLWPPTGIALVAFLRYGRRLWPGVAVGAFLTNLPISSVTVAIVTAAGNTAAPMLASWLLDRVGFRHTIDRVRDVAALVGLAALLSMTVSATIGSLALLASSTIGADTFWSAWSVWWAGDAMGILVVAPFLLAILTWHDVPPRLGWRNLPEAIALFAVLVVASVLSVTGAGPILFVLPPLVGWVAWRFQLRGAAPAVLVASTIVTWAAVHTTGWFRDLSLLSGMLTLQLFNATIAFTAFFLAALVSERMRSREALERAAEDLEERVERRTAELSDANDRLGREIAERRHVETDLRQRERELAEAQDVARIGRWEWDLATGAVIWSAQMYRIHGYEPDAFPVTFQRAIEQVPEDDRRRIERSVAEAMAEHREMLPEIEYRITRPGGDGRVLIGSGRMFFARDGTPVRMVGVVQDITERREYDRQHLIADTLQRALLPHELPPIHGFVLASRYIPAESGFRAGGDWFDVIPVADGRTALVIGDVAGHGLPAASVMGQLRMAVRAYALEGNPPQDVVGRTDDLLRSLAPDELATMLYAEVDGDGRRAVVVNAGHPPPLLVTREGARYLEIPPAPPLGMSDGWAHAAQMVSLDPESTIVLYTDGLIDRRGVPIEEGMEGLLLAARAGQDDDAEGLVERLVGVLGSRDVSDDVALIAMQALPVDATAFSMRFPAEPRQLAPARRALTRWLTSVGVEDDDLGDLVLAVSEACSNSIKHAYGPADGAVEIEAKILDGSVEILVRDFGRWRPSRGNLGGRGLAIIEGLTPTVVVRRDVGGTALKMSKRVRGSA
jgi:PAS domain S-box-containing protein